ncbi:MAG: alpha/beta fold hydrolase [Planctomycetota bacterium]
MDRPHAEPEGAPAGAHRGAPEDAAAQWRAVRRTFEALVERPAHERAALLAASDLPAHGRAAVERMLDADDAGDPWRAGGAAEASGGEAAGVTRGAPYAPYAPYAQGAPGAPRRTIGRYELLSLLGRGGMGEVHLAHDHGLDRRVALKLLAPRYTQDTRWLARFRREARVASAVNHPSILTIHEIGEVEGTHFIATEYIEGDTLRDRMARGLLSLADALDIGQQVAGALAAAHAAGIIHRDVKPENVMLRRDGFVKVLDFGLAKATQSSDAEAHFKGGLTTPGVVMGTLSYLAPEQARGQEADPRSDVFALGVLLYEMLTGRLPFTGGTPLDTLVAILHDAPPPLPPAVEAAAAGVGLVLERALAKPREARFQGAHELQVALRALRVGGLALADRGAVAAAPSGGAASGGAASGGAALGAAAAPQTTSGACPTVRYAQSGEVNIAFQVLGDGPLDLVFVMGWVSHLEYFWSEPSFARFLRRLATFSRVILFDKRGTGLSDRVPVQQLPSLEQRMDDVRAVMDAVGSRRAVLCGVSEGGPMCSLFAATYPERTIALVMIGSYARRLRDLDYPWGPTDEEREAFLEVIRKQWGGPVGIDARAPSLAGDTRFREWWAAYLRHGASPAAAVALTRMNAEVDIRKVLPTVRVPTLVVHRTGDRCLVVAEGRYLAEHIPGARFIELPGVDHLPFVGAQEEILAAIEVFLADITPAEVHDRVLATVLVAEVCAGRGARPGDDDGALERFGALAAREVGLFQGRLQRRAGGSALATFDGPARAIRAALNLVESAARDGLPVRVGLHTGECDVHADGLGGVALELAARVAAGAPAKSVHVSSTVRDLVAGAGFRFASVAALALGAAGDELRLFAVERSVTA